LFQFQGWDDAGKMTARKKGVFARRSPRRKKNMEKIDAAGRPDTFFFDLCIDEKKITTR